MYQQSIHYEVTRIGSYTDFESMEFFPEIAAALEKQGKKLGQNVGNLTLEKDDEIVDQRLYEDGIFEKFEIDDGITVVLFHFHKP